jgi:hypothetical protein
MFLSFLFLSAILSLTAGVSFSSDNEVVDQEFIDLVQRVYIGTRDNITAAEEIARVRTFRLYIIRFIQLFSAF